MKTTKIITGLLFIIQGIHCTAQTTQEDMNSKENYSVEIIRYAIPDDKFGRFETDYQEAGKYLKDSPYCLGYNILHGEDEPNHYIVTIYWTSKEDHLNGFRKSAQFSGFFNWVKPYFNHIEEMKHYNKTSISWSKDY